MDGLAVRSEAGAERRGTEQLDQTKNNDVVGSKEPGNSGIGLTTSGWTHELQHGFLAGHIDRFLPAASQS